MSRGEKFAEYILPLAFISFAAMGLVFLTNVLFRLIMGHWLGWDTVVILYFIESRSLEWKKE